MAQHLEVDQLEDSGLVKTETLLAAHKHQKTIDKSQGKTAPARKPFTCYKGRNKGKGQGKAKERKKRARGRSRTRPSEGGGFDAGEGWTFPGRVLQGDLVAGDDDFLMEPPCSGSSNAGVYLAEAVPLGVGWPRLGACTDRR